MCGIAGFVGQAGTANVEMSQRIIGQMCDAIEHRGPDDEGYYLRDEVALGMRRLAIIDITSGSQPISNEAGTIWIVFNGEIYNHRELRQELIKHGHFFSTRSDTETIVHLYEEEGEQCVERLRGMFVFAIWDQHEHKLFVARDRVGKKPLHYTLIRQTLIFGSEIKALLQHPAVKREVNPRAISDFLTFGYVPDPATAFQNIFRLPPGCVLTLKNGCLRVRAYWDFNYQGHGPDIPVRKECDYVEELRALMAESVRIRLESEVPLGAFLSGGIDSTAVVALMARELGRPVKTFSIGFSDAHFDELSYARVAARHLETEHHEFVVTPDVCKLVEEVLWHHDEPFADVSSIPTYVVSKMAREHVSVVLTGDGGDELFAGYNRYLVNNRRRGFDYIPGIVRKGLLRLSRVLPQSAYGKNFLRNMSLAASARYVDTLSYFSDDAKRSLWSAGMDGILGNYNSADAFTKLFALPASTERLDHLLYLDSKTYLPGDILTKIDRMTMAHSVEARVPLLDHKLIEFVQTIPASLKMRGHETKSILKQAVTGQVPKEIIRRSKKGFSVPIRNWFNNELRDLLYDTLTGKRTRERGLLNPQAVQGVLDEHRRRRRDNAHQLWGLLTLELWHRAFIDKRPAIRFSGAKRKQLQELFAGAKATTGALL
jgi:asparagine synthase (glutamine-hydrolysing)